MNKIVAVPQMDNYYIPAKYLFSKISNIKLLEPIKITKKTIELGSKSSPDFVCTPFKYTLGSFIETLESGANVLVQFGGGCRYGYYSELQEQILKDLGYKFTYINLVSAGHTDLKKVYQEIKKIEPNLNLIKSLYYLLITIKMVNYMDKVDDYIRHNIGFEVNRGEFNKVKDEMLQSFSKSKSLYDLRKRYKKYFLKIRKIKVNKPENCMKVGIIGELYTIMEPFANYYLEEELAKHNIEVTRFTNVTYLLFQKKYKIKRYLKEAKQYIKYRMGADASDNIARTLEMCNKNYDGIIHIKSSFCTPEIGAMPIISKIASEYKIPVIFFSFDANTSKTGIKTRLEAFYDMLEMRKNR